MLTSRPENARRPTMLELFFDLVYIVVLALISQRLMGNPGWSDAYRALILLMALCWVWGATLLITNLYDPKQPVIQGVTVMAIVGSLLMAAAIPGAFAQQGLIFAAGYVGIHLSRGLLLAPVLRRQPVEFQRAVQVIIWFTTSAVPWLAGGVLGGTWQLVLWTVALAIDGIGLGLRFWVPGGHRVRGAQLLSVAEHLGERFQQFFVVSLGDAILIIGLAMSRSEFSPVHLAAFAVTLGTTILLWRIYVHRAGQLLPAAIAASRRPARFSQSSPYNHAVMVAGVVVTAAGFDLVIRDPTGDPATGWVITSLGGPALFLAGRAMLEYEVFRRISTSRLIGILALAAVGPGVMHLPILAGATVTGLVLGGVAVADTVRDRGRPPEPLTPAY
ncbi:low temperature requirement protein A [Plantactinospora solaniradicis]|uniref:Low temperature requirement protein A n=1 Tax=Plantactinospora solaniradicis TaxID=1723736 RepID=A0ABW1KP71_9ACTN